MPATTYTPRAGSLALRVLRHMQLHRQPMTRAQMRDQLGVVIVHHLDRALNAGLLRKPGRLSAFHPTDALAAAVLDGKGPSNIFWNEDRTALLRRRYASTNTQALALILGTTTKAVWVKAKRMGLSKTPNASHAAKAPSAKLSATDDDGQPVQIIVPAGTPCAPIQTTAPNSVFALGGTAYTTTQPTTTHHAST